MVSGFHNLRSVSSKMIPTERKQVATTSRMSSGTSSSMGDTMGGRRSSRGKMGCGLIDEGEFSVCPSLADDELHAP
jgi:hypothetical protein